MRNIVDIIFSKRVILFIKNNNSFDNIIHDKTR